MPGLTEPAPDLIRGHPAAALPHSAAPVTPFMPALAFTPIVLTPFAFPPLVLPPLAFAPLALAPFVFTPLLLAPLRFLPGALLFPRAAEPIARRDVDRRRGRVHDHRLCWLDVD